MERSPTPGYTVEIWRWEALNTIEALVRLNGFGERFQFALKVTDEEAANALPKEVNHVICSGVLEWERDLLSVRIREARDILLDDWRRAGSPQE